MQLRDWMILPGSYVEKFVYNGIAMAVLKLLGKQPIDNDRLNGFSRV